MTLHKRALDPLFEDAKAFLQQCGRCHEGQAVECICSTKDPRPVILELYTLLEAYSISFPIQPLSRADENLRHAGVETMFGVDDNCGGLSAYSGPCGGCGGCEHMRVSHYFHEERREADRYHQAGLEWAPYALNWQDFTDGMPGGSAPYCTDGCHSKACLATKTAMREKEKA